MTCLHYACKSGSLPIVELLIKLGADIHAKTVYVQD
jgi:ankyrin repeat protein